jgi:hypothetical protein
MNGAVDETSATPQDRAPRALAKGLLLLLLLLVDRTDADAWRVNWADG